MKTSRESNIPYSDDEDEKIKQEIIEHLRYEIEPEVTLSEEEGNRWIAWLERQSERKSVWSEKHIADVFEKVGLSKIVRELHNDELTWAVQMAMIKLAKI